MKSSVYKIQILCTFYNEDLPGINALENLDQDSDLGEKYWDGITMRWRNEKSSTKCYN